MYKNYMTTQVHSQEIERMHLQINIDIYVWNMIIRVNAANHFLMEHNETQLFSVSL